MSKSIKKTVRIFVIVFGVITGLLLSLFLILQISEVQTFIIQKLSDRISKEFKSTIQVGKVEYEFFNRLILSDLLIKDQNNDTMIYAQRAITGIRKFNPGSNTIKFGKIYLIKPEVAFITDSTGLMNLKWYLDKLKSTSDSAKKKSGEISIDQIDLHDARFSLTDRRGTGGKRDIDFKNLKLNGLNGTIELLKIENDTTSFNIHNLTFSESSGFKVNKLSSSVNISKGRISLNKTFLSSDSSIINISEFELRSDSSGSFSNFIEDVRLKILFDKSLISSHDLQYFLPFAKEINETIWLSGKITGTISELRGRNILVSYRDYSTLDCDFDFSGLPDINNAFIYIGVNRLIINAKDIEKVTLSENRNLEIPKLMYELGNISFHGSFTGFITDFVTYGEIFTSMGVISTDLSMRPEEKKKYRIRGLLSGKDLNLGEIAGNTSLLGKMSIKANIDGYAYSMKKFAANLSGKIDSIEIKEYMYRDIALKGFFTEKTWDGSINVVDRNIEMEVLGLFNFEKKLPEFDFTLNIAKANLYHLNFEKEDTTSSVALLLTSNFKGNSIDNIDGEIRLLNSNFVRAGNNLELYDFSVKTSLYDNKPILKLRTDFVDADLTGYHNFGEFGNLARYTLSMLMPSKFKFPSNHKDLKKNNFSFKINFKNTDKINTFLSTGILIAENSVIGGDIFPDSILRVYGNSRKLSVFNNIFNDFSIRSSIQGNELALEINSSSLELLRQSRLDSFIVNLDTRPDKFKFSVNWGNKSDVINNGSFTARGTFLKENPSLKNALLKIEIDSTDINSRNKLWRISSSSVIIDSNAVRVNKFMVGSKDYFYLIDGAVSSDPSDTLNLGFKGIDINPVNYILNRGRSNITDALSLDLKGQLNGKILFTNIYKDLLLEGNLSVNKFSILGTEYGTLEISSAFDINRKVVNINSSNNLMGEKMLDITGFYDPRAKELDLTGVTKKLPITPLNPLLRVFASDINGTTSGKVNLLAHAGTIILNGALMVENSSLKIDYLKSKYRVNDSVRFDKRGINFNNMKLTDEKGNLAYLSGMVYHSSFKNFRADLTINTNDCMVLNTKPKDNELFYGTAFGTGVTTIKSASDGSIAFDISARTGRNTRFFIPLNTGLSVSEVSFVSFVNTSGDTIPGSSEKTKLIPDPGKTTGMDINIDLEVTPVAEVQLIFDLKVGDVMKANGSGDLNINLNKKGDFRITGDYIIDHGDYLFTLRNILNKPFSVENGGRIMFNGDINDAEIDLKAIYKVRASVSDIMPPMPDGSGSTERVPVECQLNLTGKLFNPLIGFNIYLPTADEKTRAYVRNATATEEQMSRQFLYLLVMNSFYPDPNMASNSETSSGTAGTAAAVTTSEMLSSQLSNMLSQITNDFDIGVIYRPGVGNSDINPDQLEVALSKQILNDKVVINGNFDVRGSGNDANTNQITGDFDAEVKLTEKIRFKVFNRYNNPYTGKTEPYTQGVGVFFRQEFNKFSDLFRKNEKSEMKKEDVPEVKQVQP
jgi:hypothetical protein